MRKMIYCYRTQKQYEMKKIKTGEAGRFLTNSFARLQKLFLASERGTLAINRVFAKAPHSVFWAGSISVFRTKTAINKESDDACHDQEQPPGLKDNSIYHLATACRDKSAFLEYKTQVKVIISRRFHQPPFRPVRQK